MLPGHDMFARTFGEHRGERSGDVRLPDPTRPDPIYNSYRALRGGYFLGANL